MISVWAIPNVTHPQFPGQKVPTAELEPLATFSYVGILGARSRVFWRETASWPLRFEVLRASCGGALDQFELHTTDPASSLDAHHTLILTGQLDLTRLSRGFNLDTIYSAWHPHSYLLVWTDFAMRDNQKCLGQLIKTSEGTEALVSESLIDFTTAHINDFRTFWFDLFSGRACALLTRNRIVILDYLKTSKEIGTFARMLASHIDHTDCPLVL
jgi:hypothetical protein